MENSGANAGIGHLAGQPVRLQLLGPDWLWVTDGRGGVDAVVDGSILAGCLAAFEDHLDKINKTF